MSTLTELITEHRIAATNPFASPRESDEAAVRMAKALEAVVGLHKPHPDGGQGYDSAGEYVWFDQVCQTCGQYDEYAVPYPCPTARAITAALTETKETAT